MSIRRSSVAALALLGMCVAVAPASFAQAGIRPAGLKPDSSSPEAGLWTLSDKAEVEAKQSAELDRDPALNEYVKSVECKVAPAYCGEVRVYVMDRPFFNASMAPNGYMEVWSGLLLRANNEAELAFALGHETGHFAHSHSWQSFQNMKARANGAVVASLIISAVGVAAMANAGTAAAVQDISNATQGLVNAVYLGSLAGMFSFSRANESEADAYGFESLSSAKYDTAAAVAIWQRLTAENAASDFPKVRKSETRASIFDTHPLVRERIEALEGFAKGKSGGTLEAQRYRAMIRPHLSAWLRDDLRRRDFGQTLFVIDHLAAGGEDLGVLNYYRGESMRLRRKDGDLVAAEQAYRVAITYPDVPAAAFRELADLAEKRHEKEATADLLTTYLQREPDAKDAAFVKMRLEQIRPGAVILSAPTASLTAAPAQAEPAAPAPAEPAAPAPAPSSPPAAAAPTAPAPSPPVATPPAPPAPPVGVAFQ